MNSSRSAVVSLAAVVWFALIAVASGCGAGKPAANDAAPGDPPGDGGATDAPPAFDAPRPDASPDAPAPPPLNGFDVAYVNEFSYPFNITGVAGFLLIINRGTTPLTLAKVSVTSFVDDNPEVVWLFEMNTPTTTVLQQNRAAGLLSERAAELFNASNLVTEQQDDDTLSFRWEFNDFAPIGADIRATAEIEIGTSKIELPFTIHIVDGPLELHRAVRVSSR